MPQTENARFVEGWLQDMPVGNTVQERELVFSLTVSDPDVQVSDSPLQLLQEVVILRVDQLGPQALSAGVNSAFWR